VLASLEPLSTTPFAYAFAVLLGLLWGSFANVCIYRMPPTEAHPNGRSVVTPGSHCFACGAPVRWYDNVPLVSYLWLRGRCRACRDARVSWLGWSSVRQSRIGSTEPYPEARR